LGEGFDEKGGIQSLALVMALLCGQPRGVARATALLGESLALRNVLLVDSRPFGEEEQPDGEAVTHGAGVKGLDHTHTEVAVSAPTPTDSVLFFLLADTKKNVSISRQGIGERPTGGDAITGRKFETPNPPRTQSILHNKHSLA